MRDGVRRTLILKACGGKRQRVRLEPERGDDLRIGLALGKPRLLLHGIAKPVVPEIRLADVHTEVDHRGNDQHARTDSPASMRRGGLSPLRLRALDDLADELLDRATSPVRLLPLVVVTLGDEPAPFHSVFPVVWSRISTSTAISRRRRAATC